MLLGILIGSIVIIVADFLFLAFDFECIGYYIIQFLKCVAYKCSWLFSPLIYPMATRWLFKHNHNPWHMSIKEMVSVSDEEFNEWLNFVPKKYRKDWQNIRNGHRKMK